MQTRYRAFTAFIALLSLTLVCVAGCRDAARPSLDGGARDGADAGPGDEDDGSGDSGVSSGTDVSDGGGQTGGRDAERPFDCATLRERADLDSPPDSASWRYGGGIGYPDAIARVDECMQVVTTLAELVGALDTAQPGDIVYVADDAAIDITGQQLCVPEGVWLAGGRGVDGAAGGMLYATEIVGRPLIEVCGSDVRITGLRIFGPDPEQCPPQWPDACTGVDRTGGRNCRDCMPRPSGIRASGVDRLEVDNNEIAGFTLAGVAVVDSTGHRVHHNHLHHNQRQGLGYGVLLGRGQTGTVDVLVDHNRMDYMRHAIAGSGEPGQDYEARDNLVLGHANGHVFDMHGENENTDNGSELAGGTILIHSNTVLVPDYYAMVIRGRPQTGAWLYDNCLARSSASEAVLQRFFEGNVFVDESPDGPAPNRYGQSGPQCEPVRWCTSSAGNGPWRYLARSSTTLDRLGFGDFDGDKKTDVFRTDGAKWHWVSSGTGSWQELNTSSATLDQLFLADFDGDGKTDAFSANGSVWRISSGASSPWQELREASETLAQLGFGDFDGDGKTDVFKTDGTNWLVSYGGAGAWQVLNRSSTRLASLGFGDFDGDGKTDAFRASNGTWYWSSGASSAWEELNRSGVGLEARRFADFDGDGKTDAVRTSAGGWFVSWGARTGWERLRIDSRTLESTAFGDFDGDGTSDIFTTGCH